MAAWPVQKRAGAWRTGDTILAVAKAALVYVTTIALQGLLSCGTLAQDESADPYTIGITLHSREGCPTLIWSVRVKSPAEAAGIATGDHVLAIDGMDASQMTVAQVSKLIRSDYPGAVVLKLSRHGNELTATAKRERFSLLVARDGSKIQAGMIVPANTTEAEVKQRLQFDGRRIAARVFPLHYPTDPGTYSGAFEIFVLRDPNQVAVGGIEDGPASRAGVHWGDRIVSVNDMDPTGRSAPELERMFSSTQRKPMRLRVERAGEIRTVEFKLERTSDILMDNGYRLVKGQVVPIGLSADDVRCFTEER